MQTTRFIPNARAPFQALLGAACALYACSFQDFDYLQKGPAAEGGGGSSGGQVQSGGRAETGGAGNTSLGGATGGSKSSDGGGPGSSGAPAGGAGGGADAGAGAGGEGGEQGGGGGAVVGGAAGQGPGPGQGGAGGDAVGGLGGIGGEGLVGNLLANPSFEMGLTGWTVDPASAVSSRYVYTQTPTSGGTTVDGSQELATWHMLDEYTLAVYQVVTGLRPGTYSFKGNFSSQRSQAAYLFARNCGGTERQVVIPPTSFVWFPIEIPDLEVSTPTCEVGFSVHNVGDDWVNADMFTFEKVP